MNIGSYSTKCFLIYNCKQRYFMHYALCFVFFFFAWGCSCKTKTEVVQEKICFIFHILGNVLEVFTKHSNTVFICSMTSVTRLESYPFLIFYLLPELLPFALTGDFHQPTHINVSLLLKIMCLTFVSMSNIFFLKQIYWLTNLFQFWFQQKRKLLTEIKEQIYK